MTARQAMNPTAILTYPFDWRGVLSRTDYRRNISILFLAGASLALSSSRRRDEAGQTAFIVTGGKPYYLALSFPLLLAAGAQPAFHREKSLISPVKFIHAY